MNLSNTRFGYDPDKYDDEPSDYVNSDKAYDADDLSRDTAEELGVEDEEDDLIDDDDTDLDDTEIVEEDDDLLDDESDLDDDVILDDSDVTEDDAINDDLTEYPSSNAAAFHQDGKKPVYIKDMPYVDHATPGVTAH